jgi:uncharacterized membrane protein YbhN (UPF0104 family)
VAPPDFTEPRRRALTIAAAAVVFAASTGILGTIAGWHDIADQLRQAHPGWLAAAFGFAVIGFGGYVFAYRGIAEVEGGPKLGLSEAMPLVAFGFGAFLVKGGEALDARVLHPGSGARRAGQVRVLALDALEHAPLAPAAWIAALYLLAEDRRKPGLDFTIPWATLVPIGALGAFFAVRHRAALAGRAGWRGRVGDVLEGIHLLFRLVAEIRTTWPAFAGSAVYWAGDVGSLWASARVFYDRPSVAGVVIAHAVGYVLTRRTLPLAGAGIVEVLMPLTLTAAAVPFSAAVAGVVVYRLFNLWLPLPPALAAAPKVETILRERNAW